MQGKKRINQSEEAALEMSNQNDYARASWTLDREETLIDLLVEYSTPHYRRHNHWTKEAWRSITEAVNRRFPNFRLNIPQVKHHEQFMRKRFNLIRRISSYPGLRWDNNSKMVRGQTSDWEKCISEIKGAHIWRDRVFPHYDKLKDIYKHQLDEDLKIDSTASGNPKESEANGDDISISSRRPSCSPPIQNDFCTPDPIQVKRPGNGEEIPSTSDVIFQGVGKKGEVLLLGDKQMSHGEEIHENEEFPSTSDVLFQGSGKKGKMAGNKRSSHGEEIHENEDYPSASDVIFQGAGKKTKLLGNSLENYLKGLLELRREEMELKKQRCEASQAVKSHGIEQFSIAKFVVAANGLGKFTDLEIIKVSKFFLDPSIRELFLSLTESQQELWVVEQLNSV